MNESYPVKLKLNFWFYPLGLPLLVGTTIALLTLVSAHLKVYLLITIIGAIFSALLLANMKNALLLLILLRPAVDFFQDAQIKLGGFGGINVASILSLMLIFGGILYIAINKVKIFSLPGAKPFLAFILIALVSLTFSTNIAVGFTEWLRLLSFFTIYVLAAECLKEKKHLNQLIAAIFISVLLPSTIGFYQVFTGTGNLETPGFNRITGTFVHPNQFAHYLLLIVALAAIFIFESRKPIIKIGMFLLSVAVSVLLFNTYTRGAWLGLILVLCLLGILKYRKLLLAIPLILLVVTTISSSLIAQRFADLRDPKPYGSGNSVGARTEIWKATYPLFLTSPFLGTGWGRSVISEKADINRDKWQSWADNPTHNDYLKILTETGIIGLSAYLWLLFVIAREGWRRYSQGRGAFLKSLAPGFLVLVVVYFALSIDSNLIRNIAFQWSFWALAAVICKTSTLEIG